MRYSATEEALIRCPMAVWTGTEPGCRWCGGEPSGRRRVWCSDECERAFLGNHMWQVARREAMRRDDYTCRSCGRVGWRDVPVSLLDIPQDDRDLVQHALPVRVEQLLELAGERLPRQAPWNAGHDAYRQEREAWEVLRDRHPALVELARSEREAHDALFWRRAHRPYAGGRARHDLEVNHLTPLAQQGRRPAGITCLHHLEGLETLCRPCHVQETTRQRRAGELRRGGPDAGLVQEAIA